MSALAVSAAPHVIELYETLRELDPARFRREMAERMRANLIRLSHEFERVVTEWSQSERAGTEVQVSAVADGTAEGIPFSTQLDANRAEAELRLRIVELATTMRELADRGEVTRELWSELRARIHPAYEALARLLRVHAVHVPSLRPTNISRSVFHVGSALAALGIVTLIPQWVPLAASAFFASAVIMETSRRVSPAANRLLMRAFSKVAHPHEAHHINSASWYATALLILAFSAPPAVSAVAVTVLGFGDPLAALIGRRMGRIRLVHGRSLEGSLAFVLFGGAAAALMLTALQSLPGLQALSGLPAGGFEHPLRVAFMAALFGGVAELFSKRLDDNLTVPLAAALGAWCMI